MMIYILHQEDKVPTGIHSKNLIFFYKFACGSVFSQKIFFFGKNPVHGPFHFNAFFKFTDSLVLKMIRIQKLVTR